MIKAVAIRTSTHRLSRSEACTSVYFQYQAQTRRFSSPSSQLDGHSHSESNDKYSSNHRKRRVLSQGRSRRKLAVKQRDKEVLSKQIEDAEELENLTDAHQDNESTHEIDYSIPRYHENDNWHILKIEQGIPMGNPIRQAYIDSQIKWKYPRTLEGWRICFRRAWNTYLWTWEGTLLSEKKRDEHGNIIGVLKEEKDEDEESTTRETMKSKATDVAMHVSQNVQKNVATIQQEAPKLLETAQRLTGITSKEELKQWATDQLKLGTECLSMFMKGYREGRDKEVDNMLHEYFKEMDEEKQTASEALESNDMESMVNEAPKSKARDSRPWGRKARRQQKRANKQSSVEKTAETAS